MGHTRRKTPKRGSKQFWPRKRAKKIVPRIRTFSDKNKKPALLGFSGYKAGMTRIFYVDNKPKSPTKGEELAVPATILEVPAMKLVAIRLYKKDLYGSKVIGEAWIDNLDQDLKRKIKLPKKMKFNENIKALEEKAKDASEVRAIVHTLPKETATGKKKPDLTEFGVGGSVSEGLEYLKSLVGKEINIEDVFAEGEFLDAHAVTTGKGFQGVVKRFGVKLLPHKAEKSRRKVGTLGPWVPKKVGYWVAQSGKMGFHLRTEFNKQLLKIGNSSKENITPDGGILNYGQVKGKFALIAGSLPGPKKRIITLTHATRAKKKFTQAPEITHISLKSHQGK